MRSSTVICVAALAAAGPSLAAPSYPPQYAKRASVTPQGFANYVKTANPILAASRYAVSNSPAYFQHSARADDSLSGAYAAALLSAIPSIAKAATTTLNRRDVQELSAREFEEVFTRELEQQLAHDLESGAWNWGKFVKSIPSLVGTVGSWFKREDLEALLARGDLDLESGAWNWGKFIKSIPSIVGTVGSWFKREELEELKELLSREDFQSGAWNWGKFVKSIPSVINTVSGWFKREDIQELFERAVLEARSLNDLD